MAVSRNYWFMVALLVLVAGVSAAEVTLFDYALNLDGVVYDGDSGVPANVDLSGFDPVTGMGVIRITIEGEGTHTVLGFFDHEIDDTTNTFFNEYGAPGGTPAAGETWEIDEPGYVFGDIYSHFAAMALDNTNAVPSSGPDDVSMAIGWNGFSLTSGQTGTVVMTVSPTEPSSGFYLVHTDPDSKASIYLQSSLTIRDTGTSVPEFPTMAVPLAITGLMLAAAAVCRKGR